ncbi:MAG: hypothetical protein ACLPID_04865 [Beijerinckiaceae bacterium]
MNEVRDLALQTTRSIRRLIAALAVVIATPCVVLAYEELGPSPDMAAWEIFAQAVASSGTSGLKQLEFETWASDEDLYGKSPPQWPVVGALRLPGACRLAVDREAAKAAGFPNDGCIMEEVRRNWAAYRYVVSHELYSKAGLAKAFQQGVKVDLPADSVQVKADWIKISDLTRWVHIEENDIRRIYYTKIERAGAAEIEYALVALHLNSKRWKNWIWATFEHKLNPGRCDEIGCHDMFAATITEVNGQTPANQTYGDCLKTPALLVMFANVGLNSIWLNYCLKGSQIAFTDTDGRPTLLGNSVIDRINGHIPMRHSSCLTCHALASFNQSGEANGAFADNAIGDVDQTRLQDYMADGFVWGVTNAK